MAVAVRRSRLASQSAVRLRGPGGRPRGSEFSGELDGDAEPEYAQPRAGIVDAHRGQVGSCCKDMGGRKKQRASLARVAWSARMVSAQPRRAHRRIQRTWQATVQDSTLDTFGGPCCQRTAQEQIEGDMAPRVRCRSWSLCSVVGVLSVAAGRSRAELAEDGHPAPASTHAGPRFARITTSHNGIELPSTPPA
jgi:hypothetical protein